MEEQHQNHRWGTNRRVTRHVYIPASLFEDLEATVERPQIDDLLLALSLLLDVLPKGLNDQSVSAGLIWSKMSGAKMCQPPCAMGYVHGKYVPWPFSLGASMVLKVM